jgi:O-acetyl-ADP-ribose deacetylase (regulator of RNase III)
MNVEKIKMIKYKQGNIIGENVDAIVNTVNCVGVMGRGLALQYKNKFPDNFKTYAKACKDGEVIIGKMFITQTGQLTNPKYIINFPTKRHWRGKSKIEYIECGLIDLINIIKKYDIKSIAIPPLGSGLGGLDWNIVKNKIENIFSDIKEINIIVYRPLEKKNIVKNIPTNAPKMTKGRAALIGLINRYLEGLLSPFISLLEIHKLVYFMQEAGEPLQLKFEKAHYGPYAQNLRHVLNVVEGHFINGYEYGGDAPDKQIKLVSSAVIVANKFLEDKQITKANFNKVSDLISGFETPFGLELLSTVHWVMKQNNTTNINQIITSIYNWNKGKKKFSEKQIQLAIDVLIKKEWEI